MSEPRSQKSVFSNTRHEEKDTSLKKDVAPATLFTRDGTRVEMLIDNHETFFIISMFRRLVDKSDRKTAIIPISRKFLPILQRLGKKIKHRNITGLYLENYNFFIEVVRPLGIMYYVNDPANSVKLLKQDRVFELLDNKKEIITKLLTVPEEMMNPKQPLAGVVSHANLLNGFLSEDLGKRSIYRGGDLEMFDAFQELDKSEREGVVKIMQKRVSRIIKSMLPS